MHTISKKKIMKKPSRAFDNGGKGLTHKGKGKGKVPLVISLRSISEIKIQCPMCCYKHPKSWNCPSQYSSIEEVPTIRPSVQEFADPISLTTRLYKEGFHKFGAVKIQAPESWNPHFSFGLADRLITTRIQDLKELKHARVIYHSFQGFEQKIEHYTFGAYTAQAKNFEERYKYQTPFDITDPIVKDEYEYWNIIDNPAYKNVKVEYAADLSATKYGSAFPNKSSSLRKQRVEAFHPFNLNNLNKAKDSLFEMFDAKISGLTSPWIYAGMKFSTFCWHVEDNYLHSINYMHKGGSKIWYIIPDTEKEKFDTVIKELEPKLFKRNPNILYTITVIQDPLKLIERGIKVYKVVQRTGDFILTFPKAYHAGFSRSANFAEAVNFIVADWIPYGIKSLEDYEITNFYKKSVFPLEWLLVENLSNPKLSSKIKTEIKSGLEILIKKFEVRLSNVEKKINFFSFIKGKTKYSDYPCSSCKEYQFLGFISCKGCGKNFCLLHNCECENLKKTIMLKFSKEELQKDIYHESNSINNKSK